MSVESVRAHLEPELRNLLYFIERRNTTVAMLMRRSGLGERRVQRRVSELLRRGWVAHTGFWTQAGGSARIFEITSEGRRNVPSGV